MNDNPPVATILVVEDQAETRRPLARLLRQEGYDVLTAINAYAAAAMIRNDNPDLILLDIGIPPMDGLTLLMVLKDEMPMQELPPVIIMTGSCDPNTQARAEALGVKEYLIKSQFETEELLGAIKKHIRSKQLNS